MKKYVSFVMDIVEFSQGDCIRTSESYFENELPLVPFGSTGAFSE